MYRPRDPVHPATVRSLYQANDVRLTQNELTRSLQREVWELAHLSIPVGHDERIGRAEVIGRWPKG